MNKIKHHIITLIIILGSFLHTQAQDTLVVRPGQLDSLRQLIENNKEDKNKVILLNEYARLCFYDHQFIKGLEAADRAKTISESENDEKNRVTLMGMYYRTMAVFYRNYGFGKILSVQADWILGERSDFSRWGGIKIVPGYKDKNTGELIEQLLIALGHFEKNNDLFTSAHIHMALADLYRWWKTPGNIYEDSEEIRLYEYHLQQAMLYFDDIGPPQQVLVILTYKIRDLWFQGKDSEAGLIEIQAANLVAEIQDKRMKALSLYHLAGYYVWNNRQTLGLRYLLDATDLLEELNETNLIINIYYLIAVSYESLGFKLKTLEFNLKELHLRDQIGFHKGIEKTYWFYSNTLRELGRQDELADSISNRLTFYFENLKDKQYLGFYLGEQADFYLQMGDIQQAINTYTKALNIMDEIKDMRGGSHYALGLAHSYHNLGDYNSSISYAEKGYDYAASTTWSESWIQCSELLAQLYEETGNLEKANEYLKIHKKLKENLEELNSRSQLAQIEISTILRKSERELNVLEQQQLLTEEENRNQRLILFSVSGALITLLVLTIIIYRNSKNRQKANQLLGQQKSEIEETLSQLKSAQSQLIHSEKMASLGELTAGIAHEIQNPLNFVNNFSDVNKELVDELREEMKNGNTQEAEAILKDIEENEQKIMHHGQRADTIVKGMLQHSRAGGGEKESTDINELADEYLRLAYHGLRAKDKSFNADFKAELDPDLPKVNVVPQDIGRVLLNLINNAFHAVGQKSEGEARSQDNKPTVILSTTYNPPYQGGTKGGVQISIKDNGSGIPEDIKDKIFQPFFTTKASGEGTGLGLSLSYDIVTKGHGGELKLITEEGKGTEFIVTLPGK